MKSLLTILTSLTLALLLCFDANAQTTAWDRVQKIEKGYSTSNWLEAIWLGANYPNPTAYTEDELTLFAELGFKTVRVPVSYEWTVTQYPPYDTIVSQSVFDIIDNTIIPIAEQYGMTVILDNHHGREINDTNFETEIPRVCGQWKFLTQYYADLPHDRYFFELKGGGIGFPLSQENLRTVQQAIIDTIRTYDTERTLIVGANEGGAPSSLSQIMPYNDDNIIYTFHSADPYSFTHQGFSWTDPPYLPATTFSVGTPDAIALENSLIEVKDWSQIHNVPIYMGSFGVSWAADAESRCNYIEFTTNLADSLEIPWIYWDIKHMDDAFGIFDGEVHQDSLIECFSTAMELSPASLVPPVSLVLPGDCNNDTIVTAIDFIYMKQAEGNEGPARLNPTIDYIPQPALDWDVEVYGINGKHQDCNGDGIVDEDDLEVIEQNYCITCNEAELEGPATFEPVHIDTTMGDKSAHIYEISIDNLPAASALSFRIDYGAFGTMQDTVIFLDIQTSWLATNLDNIIYFHDPILQIIDIIIINPDGTQQINDGNAAIRIVTIEDLLAPVITSEKLKLLNGLARTDTIVGIIPLIVGVDDPPPPCPPNNCKIIDIHPNPMTNKSNITIQLRDENVSGDANLVVVDIYGRVITDKQVNINSGRVIDPIENALMNKLKSGVYFIYLDSEEWRSKPQKLIYLQ